MSENNPTPENKRPDPDWTAAEFLEAMDTQNPSQKVIELSIGLELSENPQILRDIADALEGIIVD